MNRQVIPSMILSVLIVCFFSVLLYESEKPGAIAETSRAETRGQPAHGPSRRLPRASIPNAAVWGDSTGPQGTAGSRDSASDHCRVDTRKPRGLPMPRPLPPRR